MENFRELQSKRTKKEIVERATDPDWYGISDSVLKRMISKGMIKDPLPPDMKERLGL